MTTKLIDLSAFEGHTEGPWAFRCGHLWAEHGCRPVVLQPDGIHFRVGKRTDKMGGVMVPLTPEHPDARLIAAAPELLAEVEMLRSIVLHDGPHLSPEQDRYMSGLYEQATESRDREALNPEDTTK